MRGKIYKYMMLLVTLSIFMVSTFLVFVFCSIYSNHVQAQLEERISLIENILTDNGDKKYQDYVNIIKDSYTDENVKVISPDGTVIYDNGISEKSLQDYGNRKELMEMIENKKARTLKISAAEGTGTYYAALLLDDGNILMVSKTTQSVYQIMINKLPFVVVIFLFIIVCGHFVSGKLTKRILEPLNSVDLDLTEEYEELAFFISTINKQKREIEKQVKLSEERNDTINAILQNMKEGLILLDKNYNILSANKSALNLFSYNQEIKGKNIIELTRNNEIIACVNKAGEGISCDLMLDIGKDHYNVFFNSVYGRGILILFLEITEKVTAEKRRREFSGNISHELKTPLTVISGYAELISIGMAKKEDIKGFAKKIQNEAKRLITLIDDIMLLSDLDESGDSKKKLEQFDVLEICYEVREAMQLISEKNKVDIEVTGEKSVISGNRILFYDMILNLVDNGIKYNKPLGKVQVNVGQDKKTAKTIISVSDTGVGIEKEELTRIFERFYRIDKSRSKKTGGTGLGLSIVKHIALYHNADIEMKSEIGKGTAIYITLQSDNNTIAN